MSAVSLAVGMVVFKIRIKVGVQMQKLSVYRRCFRFISLMVHMPVFIDWLASQMYAQSFEDFDIHVGQHDRGVGLATG